MPDGLTLSQFWTHTNMYFIYANGQLVRKFTFQSLITLSAEFTTSKSAIASSFKCVNTYNQYDFVKL